MKAALDILMSLHMQALFWLACTAFAFYFSRALKRMSFGEDTGTRGWTIIALGLAFIGLRVSFKIIFTGYETSYLLQVLRFIIGIIGVEFLYYGFVLYRSALIRMFGVENQNGM